MSSVVSGVVAAMLILAAVPIAVFVIMTGMAFITPLMLRIASRADRLVDAAMQLGERLFGEKR